MQFKNSVQILNASEYNGKVYHSVKSSLFQWNSQNVVLYKKNTHDLNDCLLTGLKKLLLLLLFYYCVVIVYNMFLSKEKPLDGKWFRKNKRHLVI